MTITSGMAGHCYQLRQILRDVDRVQYRWSDEDLERHLAHALHEFSLASPREVVATVPVSAQQVLLDLGGLPGRLTVEAVEYPVGRVPRCYVPFEVDGSTLVLQPRRQPTVTAASAVDEARVHYGRAYTREDMIDGFPAYLREMVFDGGAAYAMLEWARATATGAAVQGAEWRRYLATGEARLASFHRRLAQLSKRTAARAARRKAMARVPR